MIHLEKISKISVSHSETWFTLKATYVRISPKIEYLQVENIATLPRILIFDRFEAIIERFLKIYQVVGLKFKKKLNSNESFLSIGKARANKMI